MGYSDIKVNQTSTKTMTMTFQNPNMFCPLVMLQPSFSCLEPAVPFMPRLLKTKQKAKRPHNFGTILNRNNPGINCAVPAANGPQSMDITLQSS